MSSLSKNLFNFSRSLPPPFDTLTNKKVSAASKYGGSTQSTLVGPIIKAINAFCACLNGSGQGATGWIDQSRCVAEYKSSSGPEVWHLAVIDVAKGDILACVYDKNTETIASYEAHERKQDCAALFFCLMPQFLKDDEFESAFQAYNEQFNNGFADFDEALRNIAILCDNVYRRAKDDTCPAHFPIKLEPSGNVMRVSQVQLDSGTFTPTEVTGGEFTIFANTTRVVYQKATPVIEHNDFIRKFVFNAGRKFTPMEESLIPQLPEWYIIPTEVVDICKHANLTTGRPMQMRNFLLRGPAGTGKTMGAKAIAAGLGLPYMKYTCSAGTEVFDFVGMVFPETDGSSTGNADLDRERKLLKSMGGINYANVSKLMELPDLDDMEYDPAGMYQRLTGMEKADASCQDCMAIVLEKVTEKVRLLSKPEENQTNKGQTYTYVETDFIKALKNGYLIELQEPSTILQPGVLVGLNSLLEQEGSITLPTGEIIQRHPDAVVVVTTNVNYEGCRSMNRATRS